MSNLLTRCINASRAHARPANNRYIVSCRHTINLDVFGQVVRHIVARLADHNVAVCVVQVYCRTRFHQAAISTISCQRPATVVDRISY